MLKSSGIGTHESLLKSVETNDMKMRSDKGVTLLEVMISMLVLAVGVLGLAPLMGVAIYNNTYANDITTANAMAQKEIESLLGMANYGVLPLVESYVTADSIYSLVKRVDDNSTDGTVPNGLYRISVGISWYDQVNESRVINYSALKPKL